MSSECLGHPVLPAVTFYDSGGINIRFPVFTGIRLATLAGFGGRPVFGSASMLIILEIFGLFLDSGSLFSYYLFLIIASLFVPGGLTQCPRTPQ